MTQELGPLDRLGVTLEPPALAEASVAVVVPFNLTRAQAVPNGVFKVLKPGIEERLEEELDLVDQVGSFLDQGCDDLQIPHLDYRESFEQVRDKLLYEVRLGEEQNNLTLARGFHETDSRVQIPELFDFCTPRVTAMERVFGQKVTECCTDLRSADPRMSRTHHRDVDCPADLFESCSGPISWRPARRESIFDQGRTFSHSGLEPRRLARRARTPPDHANHAGSDGPARRKDPHRPLRAFETAIRQSDRRSCPSFTSGLGGYETGACRDSYGSRACWMMPQATPVCASEQTLCCFARPSTWLRVWSPTWEEKRG